MIDPPPDNWKIYWKYFNELLTPPPPVEKWGVVRGCASGFLENLAWDWEQIVHILKNAGFFQVLRRPPENGSVTAVAVR